MMKRQILSALVALVSLPFLFETNTGCSYNPPVGLCDPNNPDCFSDQVPNSYACSCTCSPAPPRHRELRIGFDEDDAEQQLNGGILLNSDDLDFLNGRVVGLRFRNVDIPQNAMIDAANVELIAEEASGAGTLTVQIAAEAADNPLPFTTNAGDLSGRPKTANPVAWNLAAAWPLGSKQVTPNLASVLQQIVDLPGWTAGNDIVLLFTGTAGTTLRKAFSHDGNAASAALLKVEYEEPAVAQIGPMDLQVCMLPADNGNVGGTSPDDTRLTEDCTTRVQDTLSGLAATCKYPSECSCSFSSGTRKFADKCNNPCSENPVDPDCSDFNPPGGNVQATNAPGDEPVCVATSPLSSAMYGRRTTCAVAGTAHIEAEGETRNPDTQGIIHFVGETCPGQECAVGMEYILDIDSITFGNFLKSATFADLASVGETDAGDEALLSSAGDGTFLPQAVAISAQGRRDDDTKGLVARNSDSIDVNVSWGGASPTCAVNGAIVGNVDPELSRCENAGPSAGMVCEDDSQCTDDPGCSDEICNCIRVEQSDLLLSLDVAGEILNHPPNADAGADQEIECAQAAVTNIVLDATGSNDLDSNIALYSWLRASRVGDEVGFDPVSKLEQALGAQTYVLRVVDAFGQADDDSTVVDVVDTTPPVVSCSVMVPVINQRNHTLINVGLGGMAEDSCEGELAVSAAVFSDEDDEEQTGDGNYSPDAKDIGLGSLRLRGERTGSADGRVYLIIAEATDSSGNRGSDCCVVAVPASNMQSAQVSAAAQAAAAKAFCLANDGTAPAGYFEVGDGAVIGPKQ